MVVTARYPSLATLSNAGGPAARQVPAEAEAFQLFSMMSDPVIVARLDYTVVHMNEAATSLLEVAADEATRMNLHGIFSDHVRCHHVDINSAMIEQGGRISSMRVEVLGVGSRRTPCLMTVDRVRLAGQHYLLASFKDNSEVESMAFTDILTQVSNRQDFDRKIEEAYHGLRRGTLRDLSLLFIDIDHFKQCNDRFGHRFADKVLYEVAQCLRRVARVNDSVCRYGGEELAVILPGAGIEDSLIVAERLRTAVSEIRCFHRDQGVDVGVTVSIGAATHDDMATSTAGLLIEEADQAMYASKHNGRNQVTAYSDT